MEWIFKGDFPGPVAVGSTLPEPSQADSWLSSPPSYVSGTQRCSRTPQRTGTSLPNRQHYVLTLCAIWGKVGFSCFIRNFFSLPGSFPVSSYSLDMPNYCPFLKIKTISLITMISFNLYTQAVFRSGKFSFIYFVFLLFSFFWNFPQL